LSFSVGAFLIAPFFEFADQTTAHTISQIQQQIQALQQQLANLSQQTPPVGGGGGGGGGPSTPPVPIDDDRSNDEIVQLNNLRVVTTLVKEDGVTGVIDAVSDSSFGCRKFESVDSEKSVPCLLKSAAQYRIGVTPDTRLLLRNRRNAIFNDFQQGDKINVFGFIDPDSSQVIDALIVRNLSRSVPVEQKKPSITVISPNGGETFIVGGQINIRWSTSNWPENTVGLSLRDANNNHVDIIGALVPNTGNYSWSIPTGLSGGFYKVRAGCSNCTLNKAPDDSSDAPFSIVSAPTSGGALSVALDANSPGYQVVHSGQTDVELLRLRFSGVNEDIDLKQIAFQLSDTERNTPNDLVGRKITLWNGAAKIGEAVFPTGDTALSSLIAVGDFRIPQDSSRTLIVKGDIASITASGPLTTSGDLLKVDYDGNSPEKVGTYGVGLSSGRSFAPTSSDTLSSGVRIFRAFPKIAYIPLLSAERTLSAGTTADKTLYKFAITAQGGDVSLYKLTFSVQPRGITADGMRLTSYLSSNFAAPDLVGPSSFVSRDGGTADEEHHAAYFTRNQSTFDKTTYTIPAGQTRYFLFSGIRVANPQGTGGVTVSLLGDAAYFALGNIGTANAIDGDANNDFIWSGNSTTTVSSPLNLDWSNGYLLQGLPPTNTTPETIEISSGGGGGGGTSSTLNVDLDPSSPGAKTVTAGTNNVAFTTLKLSAIGGDVEVRSMSIGSDSPDALRLISNVRISGDDGQVFATERLVQTGTPGLAANLFVPRPFITIPKDTSKRITISADIAPSASGSVRLGLITMADTSNNLIVRSFNIYGATVFVETVQPSTAHWSGDKTLEDTTKKSEFTLSSRGGTPYYGTGKLGQGFLLDGFSTYFEVANNSFFRPTNAVSVAAWVRMTVAQANSAIIKKTGSPDVGYALEMDSSGTKPCFYVYAGGGWKGICSSTALPAYSSVFAHVAGTYDGKTVTVWVNGVPASAPASGTLEYGNGSFNIGRDQIYGRYFSGTIDEVGFWQKGLSENEVKGLAAVSSLNQPALASILSGIQEAINRIGAEVNKLRR
ncbi:MAG: hypothetical protein HY472_01645, partial [Candidatus Sungbacteria bacterium]|nr:hypothetical protein [Candidatus Sungbacteria bacterium]